VTAGSCHSIMPRAIVNRDTRGVIKLVAEQVSGRLLGAHVIADGAGEVVASAVGALTAKATVTQLAGSGVRI
jgi:mercuric reductase